MDATAALVASVSGKNDDRKNQKNRRPVANLKPEDRKGNPRQRGQIAKKVDQRHQGGAGLCAKAEPQPQRNGGRDRQRQTAPHPKQRRNDVAAQASGLRLLYQRGERGLRGGQRVVGKYLPAAHQKPRQQRRKQGCERQNDLVGLRFGRL